MASGSATDRAAGFMLVEVVVALAIVAMAFGYAFPSLSGALDRLGRDGNNARAVSLAQSTLSRVGHDIPLRTGDASGSTEGGFTWQVAMTPYLPIVLPPARGVAGYVVQVRVSWRERGNPRDVSISTVRLGFPGRGS